MPEPIETRIQKARPKLSLIAPLTNGIMLSFIFGNLIIAYGLWNIRVDSAVSKLPIINSFLSYRFYGVLFAALGLFMLYGWMKNDWNLMRRSLLLGVFFKSIWTVALVFAVFMGGSVAILGAWLALLGVQITAFIYFVIPPREVGHD